MDVDVEFLINSVRIRPTLWDKSTELYKDRNEVARNWREVCEEINGEFETLSGPEKKKYEKDLTTKWKTIRDGYRKALDRAKNARKSGAPASKIKKYVYHDQMDFLRKVFERRVTEDSLASDNSDPGSCLGSVEGEAEDQQQFTVGAVPSNPESRTQQREVLSTNKKGRKETPISHPDEFEQKMLHLLETPNRHICFMQGLVPTLETFTDDEVLEFQAGALNLIQKIKSARNNPPHSAVTFVIDPNQTNQPFAWGQPSTPHQSNHSCYNYSHIMPTSCVPSPSPSNTTTTSPTQTPFPQDMGR